MADGSAAQDIALIGLGDIDTATLRDDVEAALEPAGAALTLVGSVREPPDAEALVEQLLPSVERRREEEQLGARGRAGGAAARGRRRAALASCCRP